MVEPRFITVARINRSRGTRGEVSAQLLTDFPKRFESLKSQDVALQRADEPPFHLRLDSYWFQRDKIILKFQGVDSIPQAESLRGCEVKVLREEAVALPAGTYYQFDLVGCEVIGAEGRHYGRVTEVLEFGAGPLLKVESGQRELLIPFAEGFLVRADIVAKKLIFDLPEGLANL